MMRAHRLGVGDANVGRSLPTGDLHCPCERWPGALRVCVGLRQRGQQVGRQCLPLLCGRDVPSDADSPRCSERNMDRPGRHPSRWRAPLSSLPRQPWGEAASLVLLQRQLVHHRRLQAHPRRQACRRFPIGHPASAAVRQQPELDSRSRRCQRHRHIAAAAWLAAGDGISRCALPGLAAASKLTRTPRVPGQRRYHRLGSTTRDVGL